MQLRELHLSRLDHWNKGHTLEPFSGNLETWSPSQGMDVTTAECWTSLDPPGTMQNSAHPRGQCDISLGS